jgi:hypothetical protein
MFATGSKEHHIYIYMTIVDQWCLELSWILGNRGKGAESEYNFGVKGQKNIGVSN